jgi:parallel beta-helix repeat protein
MKIRYWLYPMIISVLWFSLLQPQEWLFSQKEQIEILSWQIVGQVGGPTQAATIQGDYAYAGIGMRLVVLDISNPSQPVQVGASKPFPYFIEDITIQDGYVYVAAGSAGLRVVDVSNPAQPIEVGFWDSMGYAEGVTVSGDVAYLADGPYGLRVLNIIDPTYPVEIGYAYDMNYAYDVAVSGEAACIASAGAGLLIANISDPAQPVEMASLDTLGYAYGVAITGTTAVIADGWGGIDLIDIADLAHPQQLTSFKTPGWAFDGVIVGSRLFVADAFMGLQVVDLTHVEQPELLGGYETVGGHAGNLAVSGNLAVIADRNQGLWLLDISNPADPVQVSLYRPLGYAEGVAVAGEYAYVAAGNYGLRVVDLSQPASPKETATLDLEGFASSVTVSGQYAYVCTYVSASFLYIYDLSNPAQPSQLGKYKVHIACRDVAVQGTVVYIPDEWGLEMVDVSDPTNPTQLGYLWMHDDSDPSHPGGPVGVDVSGDYAYVAMSYPGLWIVDVSDPANPMHVGTFHDPDSNSLDVTVKGSLAYLADGGNFRILDVSDPTQPAELGSTGYFSNYEVAVQNDVAFIAAGIEGIMAVDVSNPDQPVQLGNFDTMGYTTGIATDDSYVYAGDGTNGVLILQPTFMSSYRPPASVPRGSQPTGRFWEANDPILSRPALPASPSQSPSLPIRLDNLPQPEKGHFRIAGTCTVTSPANDGNGTLRACLENAVGGDTITFDPLAFPPASPVTITLASGLPALTQGSLQLDASKAGVVLDGSYTPPGTAALVILSNDNTVQGLQIVYFSGDGIQILDGAHGNQVGGDRAQGDGLLGQGNRISQVAYSGVHIYGTGTTGNRVVGNFIGTTLDGTALAENGWCISIGGGAQDNQVGGDTEPDRNLIGGQQGINIYGSGTQGNRVEGNWIGTDISGEKAFRTSPPEGGYPVGVMVNAGAGYNIVGPGNVVNGYSWGIVLGDSGTEYNHVMGNRVGTNANGSAVIGNYFHGIDIGNNAQNNLIGGALPGERNIISGNKQTGISLGSDHNTISGNYIGLDANGTLDLKNIGDGIWLGGAYNQIGGLEAGQRNVISGNGAGGINFIGSSAHNNWIVGNFVGTDATGAVSVGNMTAGLALQMLANQNTIQGNLVSGNKMSGISFGDWGTSYNIIIGNRVGTDASGTQAIPNLGNGITGGFGGASFNRVGGTGAGEGNLASGNAGCGIAVGGTDAVGNLILGNWAGTDVTGKQSLSNQSCGIGVSDSSRVIVGGATPLEGNLISGNINSPTGGMGIDGDNHVVMGNYIGTDPSGENPLPNANHGIVINRGSHVIVQGNRIAYNTWQGILITSRNRNTLRRNSIYHHADAGIRLEGGNTMLPAPVITYLAPTSITGTACASCMVEIFSDDEDEGRTYEGTTTADFIGNWMLNPTRQLTGPYITATATDPFGNTSEFSEHQYVWDMVYLPVICK